MTFAVKRDLCGSASSNRVVVIDYTGNVDYQA